MIPLVLSLMIITSLCYSSQPKYDFNLSSQSIPHKHLPFCPLVSMYPPVNTYSNAKTPTIQQYQPFFSQSDNQPFQDLSHKVDSLLLFGQQQTENTATIQALVVQVQQIKNRYDLLLYLLQQEREHHEPTKALSIITTSDDDHDAQHLSDSMDDDLDNDTILLSPHTPIPFPTKGSW